MAAKAANKVKAAARGGARKVRRTIAKVPGPSTNPATNLLIWDVAARGLTMIVGRQIEKAMLRARYAPDKASDIVTGRTLLRSMTASGVARVASRSVTGFVAVSGVLLGKAVLDRSLSRRDARRKGEKQIEEQAANARR